MTDAARFCAEDAKLRGSVDWSKCDQANRPGGSEASKHRYRT
jgi:hypothetical protein